MNRQTTILAAALAAALGMPALAQQTTPGRTGDQVEQQTQPKQSVEAMDDNAQRAHSRRDTAAQPKSPRQQQAATQRVAAGDVRDWDAVDKNDDNLISPEEMEEALKEGAKK
jgi:hypothetical protein